MVRIRKATGFLFLTRRWRNRSVKVAAGNQRSAKGGDWSPPDYLKNLIASINDGAKAAQGGMFLSLIVGLYLVATAISTSDEDLLLGRAVTISQIGVTMPVMVSFALAPLVFVFLHLYTLTRYHLLACNLRHFRVELKARVSPEFHDHCLHLLANVEFVFAVVADKGTALHSRLWRLVVWVLLGIFPLTTLFLVQISSLRYQGDAVLWSQRTWLAIDLVGLFWFFSRDPFGEAKGSGNLVKNAIRPTFSVGFILGLVFINLHYLGNVNESDDVENVRREIDWAINPESILWSNFHPLDHWLCPKLQPIKVGCRYLRVERKTLVGKIWDEKAIKLLREKGPDRWNELAAIEGLDLRDRKLRFAVLAESRLYNVDMAYAELQKADLHGVQMQGAYLGGANFQDARLDRAQMQGANLLNAQMQGAYLGGANLRAAYLSVANLQNAMFLDAQLQGANLSGANMEGADLSRANFQGADLGGAGLQGANLEEAQLQGAYLGRAELRGADLFRAQLQGANLDQAKMEGALLFEAQVWGARWDIPPAMDLAFITFEWNPMRKTDVEKIVNDVLDATPMEQAHEVRNRLQALSKPGRFDFGANHRQWKKWRDDSTRITPEQRSLYHVSIACEFYLSPYAARSLLVTYGQKYDAVLNLDVISIPVFVRGLKKRIEDKNCPGAEGLTGEELEDLNNLGKKFSSK